MECGTTISVTDLIKSVIVDDTGQPYFDCDNQYIEVFDLVGLLYTDGKIPVTATASAEWILAEDLWNDNGVWIDTETWND